jgi:hypothetical protein
MKRTVTLHTFRKLARAEEAMMRASMPRTSAADAAPLTSPILPARADVAVARVPRRFVAPGPLTYTLAEVRR